MTYLVYATDGSTLEPDYRTLIPQVCDDSQSAAEKVVELLHDGHIVWKVEGPKGFVVERERLEAAFKQARRKAA